jgi:hypothetical protein
MDKTMAELLHAETQDEVESQPEDPCTDNTACIFELDLPESPKEMRKMQKDPAQWAVNKIKHGCEVRIEDLSNEEVGKFKEAKNVEVQSWIKDQACRAATGHIPKGRVMKMRWVLTYKDTGRPKGRIVVLSGYQDPDLEHLTRSSPTMTRLTRQLLLTHAAVRRWSALKDDVKGAFLQGQGSEEKRQVYAWPVEELAEAFNMPKDQPVQLLKACCGLINAPAERFCLAMKEAGFTQLVTEPCLWRVMEWSEETQSYEVVYAQHMWTISSSQEMIEAQHGGGQSLKSMTVFFGHPGKWTASPIVE